MTTPKETTQLLTADDLLRLYGEGVRGELIRGVLHRTVSSGRTHGKVVSRLVRRMGNFVEPRGLGTILASDAGMLLERNPDTVREPDIAYISAEKMPLDDNGPGYFEGAPDLVVEVVSPNDSRAVIREKTEMWLSYGVELVWNLFPESRTVEVNPQSGPPVTLGVDDTLDGGGVLPGFACPVRDIFGR